ncbi:MAG: DNA-3-methyladenine glycosylase [Nitrosopumilus sp.]|nr:DNA-3-methyladenine glycosylase [Nitrosopumilus sp.]
MTSCVPRGFYGRPVAEVARGLLGKRLVRRTRFGTMSGIITETEAYGHADDPASHAHRGATDRNRAMFGQRGRAYVYFTYGMHWCFNIVARGPGEEAGAVLVRAAEPESGTAQMIRNRGGRGDVMRGPARLAQALRITGDLYGEDLTVGRRVWIEDGPAPRRIRSSPRVGIRLAAQRPWNFRSA